MKWRGQPLTSHEVIVNLIAGTTTRTGLTVHAELDDTTYETGIKVTDREMRQLETNTSPDTTSTVTGTTACAQQPHPDRRGSTRVFYLRALSLSGENDLARPLRRVLARCRGRGLYWPCPREVVEKHGRRCVCPGVGSVRQSETRGCADVVTGFQRPV